ncbi:iron-containing alcohol dehydrogenase [Candidatus Bathyarchaeota archaeon]|nr:MAG: iron-containing alcohol dehydrogenase [Candidatus Bathyarchaeota archaeon]
MLVPSPNYPTRLLQIKMEEFSEDIPSGEYTYLPIERVRFGPGSSRLLGEELDRLGCKKPFLMTGRTIYGKTKLVSQVEEYSGRKFAGVFHEILQHAPLGPIRKAAQEAQESGADALISLGGGSPIDSTKILVKELSRDFSKPSLPHIAIPTTLSAAEFSHTAGMTDENQKRKMGVRDPRMVPRVVFLDPQLTIPTPKWLWSSTGMRSLDHAVESIISPKHQPYVDTLALEAIRLIFRYLPKSSEDPADLTSRLSCQMAAWMSYAGPISVGTGLSHAIGRVIGARYDIPHGITSCITLAEVMRMTASKTPERLIPVALAEGVQVDKMTVEQASLMAADKVTELLKELALTKKLSSYDIPKKDLPKIAEEIGSQNTSEVLRLLERVY